MKFLLGVVDIPYVNAATGKKKAKIKAGLQTTGQIAQILEDKYGIMQHFVDAHGDEIIADLENGLGGALETLLMGGPPNDDLYAAAAAKIEERFRQFLENKEMDRMGVPGVPTLASLMNVSSRKKKTASAMLAATPARPSFIDTSLYELSFKFWSEASSS